MENRVVTWGHNNDDQEVLITLELVEERFGVEIRVIPKTQVSNDLYTRLKKDWVNGKQVEIPEDCEELHRSLHEESLLPDELKASHTGLIRQKQNEWAFIILTNKLWEDYTRELKEMKSEAEKLTAYDKNLFDKTRHFWDKVVENRKEKNINQKKFELIKEDVDFIFNRLKTFRQTATENYNRQSTEAIQKFNEEFKALMSNNMPTTAKFETLKAIAGALRKSRLTKHDRAVAEDQLTKAFDALKKERKQSGGQAHLQKRIAGLVEVETKMKRSLEKDRQELEFQNRRIDSSRSSQLEVQLRQAKLKMLEDRVESKETKLKGIEATLSDLRSKLKS